MLKKLAEIKFENRNASDEYKVIKALKDAGLVVVCIRDGFTSADYIVASEE